MRGATMKCKLLWHSFEKWRTYQHTYAFAQDPNLKYGEVRQTRTCLRCGYREDEKIRDGAITFPLGDKPEPIDDELAKLRKLAGL